MTEKQRKLLLDRDDNESQFLIYDEEKGWHKAYYCPEQRCQHLEVHHVEPDRWQKTQYRDERGFSIRGRADIDAAKNLLTMPKCVHVGICPSRRIDGINKYMEDEDERPVIHTDMREAYRNYEGVSKHTSFDVAMEIRSEFCQEGEVYWNDDWDKMMKEIAEERTKVKSGNGWQFHVLYDFKTDT